MVFNNRKYRITQISALVLSIIITAVIFVFVQLQFQIKSIDSRAAVLIAALLPLPLYLFFTRKYRKRKRILSRPFPEDWELILDRHVAYYKTLSQKRREEFKSEVQIFLGEKDLIGIEAEVDDLTRVLVGASAVIPIFNFPEMEYDNVSEVLIYPSGFNDNFDFQQSGSRILGMVGIGHSMVLSKPDLINGFRYYNDKQNVGIHEFIHKLDAQDGLIDGVPNALMSPGLREQWLFIMETEKQLLGKGDSDINPYGKTNDAEFFAVVSEYFFENPQAMKSKHSELYDILEKIYRQDTLSLFSRAIKDMFNPNPKKLGRNSPCPCGSGQKYKYCCLDKDRQ